MSPVVVFRLFFHPFFTYERKGHSFFSSNRRKEKRKEIELKYEGTKLTVVKQNSSE